MPPIAINDTGPGLFQEDHLPLDLLRQEVIIRV
jgi:hypothetical protein